MPKTAREIGELHEPWIALNTVIKNISFLRAEYGDRLILPVDPEDTKNKRGYLDFFEKNGMRDPQKKYWFNKNHIPVNQFFESVKDESRKKLNKILKLTVKDKARVKKIITEQQKVLAGECEEVLKGYPKNSVEYEKIKIQSGAHRDTLKPSQELDRELAFWLQVPAPCPKCGSRYQVLGECNICRKGKR